MMRHPHTTAHTNMGALTKSIGEGVFRFNRVGQDSNRSTPLTLDFSREHFSQLREGPAMIATGTRRRSPDPGRRVSPASRARGSSVACSPACACQRCATSHSTYEPPGAQQASVSASIETSPLGGEKGWEVRLLPAESNAKLDLPLRISMLSEALPDGWVTRNPQKKTKHAQGQAQKVVRAGHRKAKLHPDLHFRRVIEGDADGVKMKNLFEISLLSKCGDVVHAVKLEQISTHATDPWCMSAEAPGDLQHVPVHLILTLANVASSTVGSRGSTQRDVFETLLARDLAAASDLDSTAFRIASLEETDGQAVAARSEGVQGQDDAEEADGNEEVQVTEEGDLEEASVKFCFSGGNLQTSNTRVTVRAEIEILAQGDSDTLARRGLCAESIVAVSNFTSTHVICEFSRESRFVLSFADLRACTHHTQKCPTYLRASNHWTRPLASKQAP